MRQSEGEKAEIREEFAVFGKRVGWGVSHPLGGASVGVREKEDEQRRVDPQDGLYGVTLFRAASAGFLYICICGTLDPSFGSVMAKRGASVARSAAAGSRRSARSASERGRGEEAAATNDR
ncbi:hypothetical protein [Roseiflexus castenholzii]|uniref:hypothetical protein n=1 Tax=Roseiflexus castenholzii TaxID=120962 RepID=UPI00059EA6F9|nr:hypothetical protein [Roseiflexus castenholzii]